MYKYLSIVVYLFYLLGILSCKNNNFGEMNFIDLRTQTVVNVSCEQLKTKYSTKKKIVNEEESKKIIYFFKNLQKADADWKVNARVFGFINDGAKKNKFCMGNNIININGKNYFVNDSLRNYILEITSH